DGTLTYTPAPGASGLATITVTATDNGGTANGGDDSSDSQQFTIAVGTLQTVMPSATALSVAPESTFSIDLTYATFPSDATLSGLGLRIHFNSSQVDFDGFSFLLETNREFVGSVEADDSDFDGDPLTDSFVRVVWLDVETAWPGTAVAPLATVQFVTLTGFNGTTNVRLSASEVAAGRTFFSVPVAVTAAPSETILQRRFSLALPIANGREATAAPVGATPSLSSIAEWPTAIDEPTLSVGQYQITNARRILPSAVDRALRELASFDGSDIDAERWLEAFDLG
ncbi:MAG: Ig-like domain-containing protein, partial [Pirellulales bacterium]